MFNMWENSTENSKVVPRKLLMKFIQEHWFLSQTRHLKTKLTRSFSTIEKRDYPILCTKWMQHTVLFRILLQENWNIEKYVLTAYCIKWLPYNHRPYSKKTAHRQSVLKPICDLFEFTSNNKALIDKVLWFSTTIIVIFAWIFFNISIYFYQIYILLSCK